MLQIIIVRDTGIAQRIRIRIRARIRIRTRIRIRIRIVRWYCVFLS